MRAKNRCGECGKKMRGMGDLCRACESEYERIDAAMAQFNARKGKGSRLHKTVRGARKIVTGGLLEWGL